MGSVTSSGVPDLGRSVISLWFRVPGSTIKDIKEEFQAWIDAVQAAQDNGEPSPPRPRKFLGIIPLMTFGATGMTAQQYHFVEGSTGTYPPLISHVWTNGDGPPTCAGAGWVDIPVEGAPGGPNIAYLPAWGSGGAGETGGGFALDGSYIGVDCMGAYPALSVNIIAPGAATIQGTDSYEDSFHQDAAWQVRGAAILPCPGPTRQADFCYTETYVSQSQTVTKKGYADIIAGCCPETFRLLPAGSYGTKGVANRDAAPGGYGGTKVTEDHWHHMLLSLDLFGSVKANGKHFVASPGGASQVDDKKLESSCKMYLAFDGVNKVGGALSIYAAGENNVGTVTAFYVRGSATTDYSESHMEIPACGGVEMSRSTTSEKTLYDFTVGSVDGSNLGLPASSANINAIRHVEMAELQIFTGVSIDTAEPRARQAFIYKGRPVSPTKKYTEESPYSGSIEYMTGATDTDEDIRDRPPRLPEVLLHGTKRWQRGDNTGTGSEFDPSGNILRYKPDPSLGGDQGEPQ